MDRVNTGVGHGSALCAGNGGGFTVPCLNTQDTFWGVSSNISYLGVRAVYDLAKFGFEGWAFLAQYETLVAVTATPIESSALGSRDSYLGMRTPWGSIKIGKEDTPYKKATVPFDPFYSTLGTYNSLWSNTGGDSRAEFAGRLPHSIWYESPDIYGFTFSALVSPGQNLALNNSDFPLGEYTCSGSTPRSSGSGFPALFPNPGGCIDGSFGTAFSAAGTYKNGPFTIIGGYELHKDVNRLGDEGVNGAGVLVSGVGVHDEWAAEIGAGYRIWDTQLYAAYEHLVREGTNPAFNERSKDDFFASVTQYFGEHWEANASYIHATSTPGDPQSFPRDNGADQYSIGGKYKFTKDAYIYAVGTYLDNHSGAHYCLGAGSHGISYCGRDVNYTTIPGTQIKGISTGLVLNF